MNFLIKTGTVHFPSVHWVASLTVCCHQNMSLFSKTIKGWTGDGKQTWQYPGVDVRDWRESSIESLISCCPQIPVINKRYSFQRLLLTGAQLAWTLKNLKFLPQSRLLLLTYYALAMQFLSFTAKSPNLLHDTWVEWRTCTSHGCIRKINWNPIFTNGTIMENAHTLTCTEAFNLFTRGDRAALFTQLGRLMVKARG